jgi:hypothetical protein
MRQGVVSQMLRNRFYIGEVEFLGQTRRGVQVPLVDEATFQAVQRRLRDETGHSPAYRAPTTYLTGLVFCACGQPLYRQGMKDRPAHFLCAGQRNKDCPGIGTPRLDQLEPAVLALALRIGRNLNDDAPDMVVRQSKATRLRTEVAGLDKERAELLKAIGRLGSSHAKGVMDEAAYGEAVRMLQDELATVEARLLAVKGLAADTARPVEELRSAAERLESLWQHMTAQERRASVRLLLPDGVRVRRAKYRDEPMLDRLTVPEES